MSVYDNAINKLLGASSALRRFLYWLMLSTIVFRLFTMNSEDLASKVLFNFVFIAMAGVLFVLLVLETLQHEAVAISETDRDENGVDGDELFSPLPEFTKNRTLVPRSLASEKFRHLPRDEQSIIRYAYWHTKEAILHLRQATLPEGKLLEFLKPGLNGLVIINKIFEYIGVKPERPEGLLNRDQYEDLIAEKEQFLIDQEGLRRERREFDRELARKSLEIAENKLSELRRADEERIREMNSREKSLDREEKRISEARKKLTVDQDELRLAVSSLRDQQREFEKKLREFDRKKAELDESEWKEIERLEELGELKIELLGIQSTIVTLTQDISYVAPCIKELQEAVRRLQISDEINR
ncbi:MAG TPA: hypothetical protein PKA63_11140 [Oligoflexia bacterium]|nr:hypothetical protein [Oligoflexia bacterium]HMP49213.1 hypothetical protein [Oligoflexia bacterium]